MYDELGAVLMPDYWPLAKFPVWRGAVIREVEKRVQLIVGVRLEERHSYIDTLWFCRVGSQQQRYFLWMKSPATRII